jgi:dTDP-4-dehydrorhamnose reductase
MFYFYAMKKILITGSNGLLGQKLITKLISNPNFEVVGISRGENRVISSPFQYRDVNICDPLAVHEAFDHYKPEIVIHTAAMTNVDICESDKEGCIDLNVNATQYILDAAKKWKSHIIHLSTDFIFDGEDGPYKEEAPPNPLSFYGHSKWDAEKLVMDYPYAWSIVRTVLVYGVVPGLSRSNIVLWAKGALEKGDPIKVVNDQFRTPTLAEDLAEGCIGIAEHGKTGIYNISGPDFMSVLELVERVARFFNLSTELINPISSTTLNQAAKRPPRTGFDISKARKDFGYQPHTFEKGLELVFSQLGK